MVQGCNPGYFVNKRYNFRKNYVRPRCFRVQGLDRVTCGRVHEQVTHIKHWTPGNTEPLISSACCMSNLKYEQNSYIPFQSYNRWDVLQDHMENEECEQAENLAPQSSEEGFPSAEIVNINKVNLFDHQRYKFFKNASKRREYESELNMVTDQQELQSDIPHTRTPGRSEIPQSIFTAVQWLRTTTLVEDAATGAVSKKKEELI